MLKLLAHLGLSSQTLQLLRHEGLEVYYLPKDNDSEAILLEKTNAEGYLLLTGDRAVAQAYYEARRVSSGIICLELSDNLQEAKVALGVLVHQAKDLVGAYSHITGKGLVKHIKMAGA